MLFNYLKLNPEDNEWIFLKKDTHYKTSLEKIACDAVFYDLLNGYSEEIDSYVLPFTKVSKCTYWYKDSLYCFDDIVRVFINDEYFVFSKIYITQTNNIIVEVVKPKDIWEDDTYLFTEIDDLEPIYFKVEY